MFHGLFIASLISTVTQLIKEACQPIIPAENWANSELIHKDKISGISEKEFNRNLSNGKYKITETYPEPHREPETGKIIIENCRLYYADVKKYGAVQAQKWVKQGKYNLTPEELEKEREYYKNKMDNLYKLL